MSQDKTPMQELIERLSRFFTDLVIKYKTRRFEKEFDKFFTGLLLGDLYEAKINLLTYMKQNKDLMLKKYLEGQSIYCQIKEPNNLINTIQNEQYRH